MAGSAASITALSSARTMTARSADVSTGAVIVNPSASAVDPVRGCASMYCMVSSTVVLSEAGFSTASHGRTC